MEKINQKLPLSDEEYDDEEGVEEGESSGSEEIAADDDSEEDPTFDVLEETQSSLSRLSLKKTKSRISKVIESGNDEEEEPDDVEIKVPELNAKDAKSYETIEKIIAGGQVEKLKVEQCKVYLRKNGLRLTGKKDVLIDRIKEHLGIINGGGELKYPASSFVYNCKGDACCGDVVMFEQNVYEMYNIASRSATGPPCGTRTIAGRIVKESYGSAKQQHTFTIEVLWSKGVEPLPPLHPLLIKGRNLYKLKTMRQLWADEELRRKVLLEKHSRGSLARSNRETRIQQKELRKKITGQRC
ncbi:zinc finger CCCH domain-containing protein 62-like [Papaver somniferum]|uniref:zinc finger CCCH domain-containing protein 62-like n=1 Tax=Papaver somniferum TaxID=3469 RepID=UPI000E701F89|nr:zinc finger CCCH domain-containing protein 62-like [Papaver somniferum]